MAMLRLASRASKGRANLHTGGIGVGIDLQNGVTTHAMMGQRWLRIHPDSELPLCKVQIPAWEDVLTTATRCAEAVALGYLGVDLTLDAREKPCILELNARPGLSIQLANRRGLRPLIDAVEKRETQKLSVSERVRFGQELGNSEVIPESVET